MLYIEPKLELLESQMEDVIRTSYQDPDNPGEDYSDTTGKFD